MHGWDVQPRHSQNRAFSAFRCCAATLLRLQDAMLIKWRSFHASMQTDFHASMKSVHKDAWLNWELHKFLSCTFCKNIVKYP